MWGPSSHTLQKNGFLPARAVEALAAPAINPPNSGPNTPTSGMEVRTTTTAVALAAAQPPKYFAYQTFAGPRQGM